MRVLAALAAASLCCAASGTQAQVPPRGAVKQILLIADKPSHGKLQHEHNAAVWLLQKWLSAVPGVKAIPSYDGWPSDLSSVDSADAIFLFSNGDEGHPLFADERRIAAIKRAAARGAGLMLYHWTTEPPPGTGRQEFLDWVGGYFELDYSVNPMWEARVTSLPPHPIARGVQPFTLRDEWYYNMRFVDGMRGITPILQAVPPPESIGPDGPRSGNADVRAKAGRPHTLLWAYERAGGGRSVGMTGGHFHVNLGNDNLRKVVLNSLVWIARVEVPSNGVSVTVRPEELNERLDPKP